MLFLAKGDTCIIPTPKDRFTIKRSFSFLFTVALLFISSANFAQAPCSNSTLGCYGQINLAVNGQCEAIIEVEALISNHNPLDTYSVTFTAEDGTTYTGNDIGQFLGQTLTFSVADNCGNSCWGYITVEDKTGAILRDCDEIALTCEEFLEGNSEIDYRPGFDPNCNLADAVFTFEDDTLSVMCQNGYANAILRTWTVLNPEGGFIAECEQRINIELFDLASVVFPTDLTINQTEDSTCDIFSDAGLHPDEIGYPEGILCPNFNWYYSDTEFDIPCISRKILRKWTVIDWCTGEVAKGEQVIKVLDILPPYKVCPPDTIKFPSHYGCTSNINLDPLNLEHGVGAIDTVLECSGFDVIVEYLGASPGTMQPAEDGMYTAIGIIEEDNGTYTLPLIPEGIAWVRYRFIDECGNESPLTDTDRYGSCYFEVQVVDGVPPTAICEGYTNVNLDHYGYAVLNATDIDDHSNDACGDIAKYEIKRTGYCDGHASDLDFGPSVHFCCDDVGTEIWVTLRVYDEMGNYSECEGQVIVNIGTQGTGSISIDCPDDITLDCSDDYHYYNFPEVTVGTHGDCSTAPPYYTTDVTFDASNITGCGTGYITRTVALTFTDGTTTSCSHRIYIEAADPIDPSDISVQSELNLAQCNATGGSLNPNVIGGKPIIDNNSPCLSVSIDFTDVILPGTADHCQIVERTWVVTDFCATGGSQDYSYVQHIRLSDNYPPTFTNCANAMYSTTDGDCDMQVLFSAGATDNCTPDELLDISWTLDVFSDGIGANDLSGYGASIFQVLPIGDHSATFTAVDACGNSRDCNAIIMVKGGTNTGPTPICLTEIEWTLNPFGEAEIWASDFNFASHGGCAGTGENLFYSFSNPAFEITSVIPNGLSTQIPVQIWVYDASGNASSCTSILTLTDILDVCPNQSSGPMVYGRLSSENGQAISEIEVALEDMTMNEMNYQMSTTEGEYAFENMNYFSDYMVKPQNDENHLMGVSTLDLVKIQQHILGIKDLDSPYKLIAADVNKSGGVSAIDLIQIRKLILGQVDKFPDTQSWTFVKENYVFADANEPWGYEDQAYIQNLSDDSSENNFTAIKMGDVNGSAISSLMGETVQERNQAFILKADEQSYKAGDQVKIPIYSSQFDNVFGIQFTMESKSMDLLSVKGLKY